MPWEIALSVTLALAALVGVLAVALPKQRSKAGSGRFGDVDLLDRHPDRSVHAVLFSSDFCAKCPAVRRVLSEYEANSTALSWSEINLSNSLELAKKYHILRTPTVFLLDGNNTIVQRLSGELNSAVLHHHLDRLLSTQTEESTNHVNR